MNSLTKLQNTTTKHPRQNHEIVAEGEGLNPVKSFRR